MAIRQKLKGDQNNPNINKTYDVLINFNKGIDKRAADDLANDSSFRELSNFWNEKEGILTKRPGLYDTHFTEIIDEIYKAFSSSTLNNSDGKTYDSVISVDLSSANINSISLKLKL